MTVLSSLPMSDVARQIHRKVTVDPEKSYRLLGMKSQIGGPFVREKKIGSEISASTLNQVRAGDFIYSRLFAWQGAFGVVPEHLDGAFVSGEFPLFELDSTRVDARFLVLWFGLPASQKIVEADCFGSTPGTRNRYKESYFLRIAVPLPPLDEQQRIVAQLDRLRELIEQRRETIAAVDADLDILLRKAFGRIIAAAPYCPMSEVAPLVRRQVTEIDPNGSYPALGVRSFGRGTFHKPTIPGSDITWQKLFRVEQGDLLFSNIKAWEGAFAVAVESDHGRYGSHRYLTCVPVAGIMTPRFLWYYLQSPEGIQKVQRASPGSADRNRTLGQARLAAINVPRPPIEAQQWFNSLSDKARRARRIRQRTSQDISALTAAILREAFAQGATETPMSGTSSSLPAPSRSCVKAPP